MFSTSWDEGSGASNNVINANEMGITAIDNSLGTEKWQQLHL